MSGNQGYGSGSGWGPPPGPPGYPAGPPAPQGPGHGYGYPPPPPERTNVLAVLGLVFAFVFWPVGIVLSAIGLSQTRRGRERGHGLAVAGLVVSIVAGVVAVVLVLTLVAFRGSVQSGGSAAATSPPAGAAPSTTRATGATVSCRWLPDTRGGSALVDVGTPPTRVPGDGTAVLRMTTNQGDLGLALDRSTAPCASASFTYLAEQHFFDRSSCHRQVDQPTFGVLQCGDPSGTGSGGPTYRYAQEVTDTTTYPRGTIAMANSGSPNSTGSQFFLCFVDTQLSPDYTAVGTVDAAGLAVLDRIAAAGDDGSLDPSPGGGKPNLPVTVTAVTVVSR